MLTLIENGEIYAPELLEGAGAVPVSALGEVKLFGAAQGVKAYSTLGV